MFMGIGCFIASRLDKFQIDYLYVNLKVGIIYLNLRSDPKSVGFTFLSTCHVLKVSKCLEVVYNHYRKSVMTFNVILI